MNIRYLYPRYWHATAGIWPAVSVPPDEGCQHVWARMAGRGMTVCLRCPGVIVADWAARRDAWRRSVGLLPPLPKEPKP